MAELSMQKTAQRLRIYIGDSDRWRGKSLASALLETLRAQGAAGTTVFRGNAGFGAHSKIHSDRIEVLSIDLPVVIEVIESNEKIAVFLDIIGPMVREGLITVEDVQIIKYTHRYLNPLPADRLVSEVMTKSVVSIQEETSVCDAWKLMLKIKMKALPVSDQTGKVVGLITDEDLIDRAGIQQRLSIAIRLDRTDIDNELSRLENSTQRIKDVMTTPVITVKNVDHLGTATMKMVKSGLKRMPVVDDHGKLVGMLSRLDILRQVAQPQDNLPDDNIDQPRAGKTVGDIMTTSIPTVNQDETLPGIIETFAEHDTHRMIVTNTDGKVVGLISDSDVVTRVDKSQRNDILSALRNIGKPKPGKETAFDLMSPDPLLSRPDLGIVEAIQLMLRDARKWLVVIDETNKPIGLVNRQLLLESIADNGK